MNLIYRLSNNMYVCICNAVTDKDIKKAVAQGHDNYDKICQKLKVGTCCRRCKPMAQQIIQEANANHMPQISTDLDLAFA